MIVHPISKQKIPLCSKDGKTLLKQYIHSYNQQKQATLQMGGSFAFDIWEDLDVMPEGPRKEQRKAFDQIQEVIDLRSQIAELEAERRSLFNQYPWGIYLSLIHI